MMIHLGHVKRQTLGFLSTCVMVSRLLITGADAAIIAENVPAPPDSAGSVETLGQRLITPSGGPWNQITFNFYLYYAVPGGGNPFATNTLFLLTQEYVGFSSNLSSGTSGYVAQSSGIQAEDGGYEWTFPIDTTLDPDTEYWFYMGGSPGAVLGISTNTYADGYRYYEWAGLPYQGFSSQDMRFQLEGALIPEPATGAVITAAAFSGLLIRLRKKRR